MADFVAGIVPSVRQENIVAAVRSEEQVKAISDTGVKAIRLDLSDADAVIDSIQAHDSKSRATKNEHAFQDERITKFGHD